MKKLIITIVALLIMVSVAWAYTCQYCGGGLYFTGQTKVEYGKLAYLYKCPAGHMYWIVK